MNPINPTPTPSGPATITIPRAEYDQLQAARAQAQQILANGPVTVTAEEYVNLHKLDRLAAENRERAEAEANAGCPEGIAPDVWQSWRQANPGRTPSTGEGMVLAEATLRRARNAGGYGLTAAGPAGSGRGPMLP
jgi:hypothetical protein